MLQDPRSPLEGLQRLIPRNRPLLLALPVALLAGIIVIVAFASGGGGNGAAGPPGNGFTLGGLAEATAVPTPEATIDLNRPTVVPSVDINPTAVSEGDRFVIPRFGVNAPLTLKTVGLDGVMPEPNGPDDVAIYNFSAWPGKGGSPGRGGNVVLAGHVDSGSKPCKNGTVPPPCQAVLWDLSSLRMGDEIQLVYGGQTYTYRVNSNEAVSAADGPWDQIVSSTAQETLTVITCGGNFNRVTRSYSHRQVVTAVRVS